MNYCFEDHNFDIFEGVVPSYPIYMMPSLAFEARALLEGCDMEAIRSLQYLTDDAIEKMREFYVSSELDQLAKEIKENRDELNENFSEIREQVVAQMPDFETATVGEIRKILEIWRRDFDTPLLPAEDDLDELDALEWAIWCGELECDEPMKCIAILALRSIASYAHSIDSPDSEWEGVVLVPLQVARLINASNDSVAAISAMRLIDRCRLELLGDGAKSFSEERARHAAKQRYADDPKQLLKKLVHEHWLLWKKTPGRYKNKSAFSLDMLDKYESLRSQRVLERWCKA